MSHVRDHAVVVGASMAGLLTTRVLADHYDRVTIVERDLLPDGPGPRRGVPQGRHAHQLLGRGAQVLEDLFSGILDEFVQAGAPALKPHQHDFSNMYFDLGGHVLTRHQGMDHWQPKHQPMYFPTRLLLEGTVRARVQALPNVALLDGHAFLEPTAADGGRVTGVAVRNLADGTEDAIGAELVVDAGGKGSRRIPAFLDRHGLEQPPEDEVVVHLMYSSQLLRPTQPLSELLVIIGAKPGRPTGLFLLAQENGTAMLTVLGMAGIEPPGELPEMIDFASDFAPPQVIESLRSAIPIGDVARYKLPACTWRRYDKLRRFPEGLLVAGDAMCTLNPVYGQGMAVAALQAEALRSCLEQGDRNLARRFFKATAKPIGAAWEFASGADRALPEIEGRPSAQQRLGNAWGERILTAAETDPEVAITCLDVNGFTKGPSAFFHPRFVTRVVRANRRRTRTAETAAP